MEREQSPQPTGTNRSNPPDPELSSGLLSFRESRKTVRVQRQAPPQIRLGGARPRPAIRTLPSPSPSQIPAPGPNPLGKPRSNPRTDQARVPGGRFEIRAVLNSGVYEPRGSCKSGGLGQPGGHSEGPNTRSHPELGRENPQRRWYCRSSGGRAGRRQARQPPQPATPPPPIPVPAIPQPHQSPIPISPSPISPRGGAAR